MAPGIQVKLNTPKATTASVKYNATVAAKTATRCETFAKPSTTSGLGGGTRYGIGAERSKIGTGQHHNARAFYNNTMISERNAANSRAHFSTDFYGPQIVSCNHDNTNKMSTLEKVAMWTTLGVGVLGATAGIIGAFNSSDSSAVAGNSVKSRSLADSDLPTTDGAKETSASLTAMKGAKDSSTLRDSIGIAKADKTKMEGDLKQLEANLPQMKEASEAATKQLAELKPKVAEAKEARDTAEANKKDAEGVKNANEKALNVAQERLTGAKDGLVKAKDSLISAKQTLGSAKATLAATPETITQVNADGTTTQVPNPDFAGAKEAVAKAEQAVQKAEAEFNNANDNYNAATDAEKKAQSDFKAATEQLAKSEEHLAEMTTKFEKLEAEYKKLEGEQSEAQKKVDDYNNALTKQTELKSQISQLESEIPAQEKRLTELEQKEEKGFDAAANIILKMQNKIAGKDGILQTGNDGKLKGDDKKLSKQDQEKYNNAINLQRNVGYTKLRKMAVDPEVEYTNNQQFRKGTFNVGGKQETLYMIGNKPVTEGEYNQAIARARDAEIVTG